MVRMQFDPTFNAAPASPGFSDPPTVGGPEPAIKVPDEVSVPSGPDSAGPPRIGFPDDLWLDRAGSMAGEDLEKQPDTNLDRPRAEQRGGGGGPTRSREEEDAYNDEDEFKSDLLDNVLGLQDSRVGVFGWLQGSFTGNPARPRDGQNFGVNPNNLANQFVFQQLYFVIEQRVRQGDDLDFGFRFDSLYGNDWQQYHMTGLFDNAFNPNGFGYEPVQLYGEVHLPYLTEGGIDVKAGRFFGLAGYESAMAPSRPLDSASYMFGYSQPFTHLGVMSVWHVSDQVNVYEGLINGWDRWFNEHDKWGIATGLSWDSKDGKTNLTTTFTGGPNQFNRFLPARFPVPPANMPNPPFEAGRRDLLSNDTYTGLFSTILIHEWSDALTLVVETNQGFETNFPGIEFPRRDLDGSVRNGAWYGVGGWLLYRLTDNLTGVYRAEWFRDVNGTRTGFNDNFYEMTLGLIAKPRTWLWFRPEIRYDWATGQAPYDDGRRHDQLTLGFDTIFLF